MKSIDNYPLREMTNLMLKKMRDKSQVLEEKHNGSITPTTKTGKVRLEVEDIVNLQDAFNKTLSEKLNKEKERLREEETSHEKELKGVLQELKQRDIEDESAKSLVDYIKPKVAVLQKFAFSFEEIEKKNNYFGRQQKIIEKTQELVLKEKDVVFETVYQENISEKQTEQKTNGNIPLVLHYGINVNRLGNLVNTYLSKEELHPIEQVLFEKAFQVLKNEVKSAGAYLGGEKNVYPNNIVLVDFFVRTEENTIKKDEKTELPETHTVVLWKKENDKIVLIDPSKIEFSNYLCIPLVKLFKSITVAPSDPEGSIIYSSQGKETGYSKYTEGEPKPRDCVDIAVKIAFEVNEQQKVLNNLDLVEQNVFSQISNKKGLNESVDGLDGTFIRELQSSNDETRKKSKKVLENKEMQGALLVIKKGVKNSGSLSVIEQVCNTYNSWKQNKKYLEDRIDAKFLK